jgi:hypothetical protein
MESPSNDLYFSATEMYLEEMSINSLLKSVEDFHRVSQEETIDRLKEENVSLSRQIKLYQESWAKSQCFLEEMYQYKELLQDFLSHLSQLRRAAEKDWLAVWGIYEGELAGDSSYSLDLETWI